MGWWGGCGGRCCVVIWMDFNLFLIYFISYNEWYWLYIPIGQHLSWIWSFRYCTFFVFVFSLFLSYSYCTMWMCSMQRSNKDNTNVFASRGLRMHVRVVWRIRLHLSVYSNGRYELFLCIVLFLFKYNGCPVSYYRLLFTLIIIIHLCLYDFCRIVVIREDWLLEWLSWSSDCLIKITIAQWLYKDKLKTLNCLKQIVDLVVSSIEPLTVLQ